MRAIITYHSIDTSGSVISVDPATFRAHAAWMGSSRVPVVSLNDLMTGSASAHGLAVTFDDGFVNFATEAWPALRDHRVPVTLFVTADRAGRTNDWNAPVGFTVPVLPLLDWAEIGRLAEEGVTIGSHSRTHPDLRGLAADDLHAEIAGAADRIEEETGARPGAFAYPFGWFDEPAAGAVRATYRWACTTEFAVLPDRPDPHRLPRLDAYYYRRAGRLERFGTPQFRRHLWMRAGLRRTRQRVAALKERT